MSKLTKALTAAAGNAGESLYVEDVFSTNLYVGNGSALVVNTGLDQQTEGGMLWVKSRSDTANNGIWDTERTNGYYLPTNSSDNGGNISAASGSVPFLRDGSFRWNSGHNWFNKASSKYASWAFRKAEKFFDVVTWTGDGVAGREIAHNLGSVPAVIITKRYDASGAWWTVYHKNSPNSVGWLNETNALDGNDMQYYYGNGSSAITPTSSVFTVSDSANVNGSSATYVAYLFASDAGGFGDDGSESIIKCGSYTGNGSTDGPDIDLGFEPQWVLVKRATGGISFWGIYDSMRGVTTLSSGGGEAEVLYANLGDVADTNLSRLIFTPTGFSIVNSDSAVNGSGSDYIYIAIRRPMKTPESGTEVFAMDTAGATAPSPPLFTSGFPVDFYWWRKTDEVYNNIFEARLTGQGELHANTTNAQGTDYQLYWDTMTGARTESYVASNRQAWMFKRATGFFDVVAYTGNATVRTVPHNLGVVPELMIVKKRNTAKNWYVYSAADSTKYLYLNGTNAFVSGSAEQIFGNDSTTVAPTSSVFSLGSQAAINGSGDTFINYLFASVAGVSKVGSYTGTGSNVDVDCGFSAGARFILIKRTDSTGDWYVWDSVRGIVAGNDPYLLLNTTAAEVTNTDYIDPLSSGFTVTSSAPAALNASGGTYIFMAIS